jgi:hypothetical protein
MAQLSTAIFATRLRPDGQEKHLAAHALLHWGARPYWQIFIGPKKFNFIPDPEHMLEDGLWQLSVYCQMNELEYLSDPTDMPPLTLEEEFGDEVCKDARKKLAEDLKKTEIQFYIVSWSTAPIFNASTLVDDLQQKGASVYLTKIK